MQKSQSSLHAEANPIPAVRSIPTVEQPRAIHPGASRPLQFVPETSWTQSSQPLAQSEHSLGSTRREQPNRPAKRNRVRGCVLTRQGWEKLMQAGILYDNWGNRRSYESLSEQSLLDVRTVSRILSCEVKVDKRTLKTFFRTFNLELETDDYCAPTNPGEGGTAIAKQNPTAHATELKLLMVELMTLMQQIERYVENCGDRQSHALN